MAATPTDPEQRSADDVVTDSPTDPARIVGVPPYPVMVNVANRLRPAGASIRRRAAWIGGAIVLVILGLAVLRVGLDRTFLQGLLATFIGAVLGFLVALYIDRHQRAEEAETQRDRDAAAADLRRKRDDAAAET